MPSSHKYAKIARPCVAPFSFGGYLPFYIFLNLGQDTRAGKDQGAGKITADENKTRGATIIGPSITHRPRSGRGGRQSLTHAAFYIRIPSRDYMHVHDASS